MDRDFTTVEDQKLAARFREIVIRECADWADVGAIVAACERHEFFPRHLIATAIESAKKRCVRGYMRSIRRYGHEFVSVIQTTASGRQQRAYKQLALFDVADFVQVVADRLSRVQYFASEVERFARLAVQRFGDRAKDLLPGVDWEGSEPKLRRSFAKQQRRVG